MAAWDYVSMPSAPAAPSYAAPLVNFSPLGDLAKDYYSGQQQQRQLAIQNAFKEGFPTDDQGQPDYKAAANKLFQLGGYDQGMNLLKIGYGQQAIQGIGDTERGLQQDQSGGGVSTATAAAPAASATAPIAPVSPQGSTNLTGPDRDTIAGPPQNIPPNMSTADAVANVQRTGAVQPGGPQGPGPQVAANLQPQPVPPNQDPNAPIVPRAVATVPASQAPPIRTAQAGAAGPGAELALRNIPAAFRNNPLGWANRLDTAAGKIENAITGGGIMGVDLKAKQEEVKSLRKQAQDIRNALAPTEAERDVIQNVPARKIQEETAQKRAEATYTGIGQAARLYETGGGRTYNDMAKSLLNQPAMYTGFGNGVISDANKLRAVIGGDPRAAQYQEALAKLTAADVQNTINETKAEASQGSPTSAAGRIFGQQVELAMKTAYSQENTLAGNRYLAEMKSRMGEYQVHLRDMAADYYSQHKTLDEGFDRIVKADLEKHPLFTKQEMQNPSLIGAPTSPYTDKGRLSAWAQQMGLKAGDAVRLPPRNPGEIGPLVHVPVITVHPRPGTATAAPQPGVP